MLYELLFPLRHDADWLGFLNVLRYVPFRTIAATVTAMLLAFVLAPWFIRELQRKQIGQVVRSDGPETHKIKSGTPTMGGALILLCVLVPTILWCDPRNVFVWATTAVTAGYGVIGYLDDYLKIKLKNSQGRARPLQAPRPVLDRAAASSPTPSSPASTCRADWWDIRFNLGDPVRRVLEAPDRAAGMALPALRGPRGRRGPPTPSTSPTASTGWPSAPS